MNQQSDTGVDANGAPTMHALKSYIILILIVIGAALGLYIRKASVEPVPVPVPAVHDETPALQKRLRLLEADNRALARKIAQDQGADLAPGHFITDGRVSLMSMAARSRLAQNPSTAALLAQEAKIQTVARYRRVLASLGLTPEQLRDVESVLGDYAAAAFDVADLGMSKMPVAQANQQLHSELEAKLAAIAGPNDAKLLTDIESNYKMRPTFLDMFQRFDDSGAPLSADQFEQLMQQWTPIRPPKSLEADKLLPLQQQVSTIESTAASFLTAAQQQVLNYYLADDVAEIKADVLIRQAIARQRRPKVK